MRHFAASAALILSAAPAIAQEAAGDTVAAVLSHFEAGILCAQEVIGTSPAPDTVAGITNIIENDPPFVSNGRQVPAVLGVGFGVKAQSAGIDYPEVTMVLTHPPMGPEGMTRQSYTTSIGTADTSISFYQLEYDYELVIGHWTFTAMAAGKVLYSAGFDVVDPRQVPELGGLCGYEHLLS